MSLILDALRKMEQERRSRRAAGDLRPEVLRYRGVATSQQAKPYLLVVVGIALLVTGVGAGFVLKGERVAAVSQKSEQDGGTAASAADSAAPPATVLVSPTAPTQSTASPAAANATAAPAAPVVASGLKPAPAASEPARLTASVSTRDDSAAAPETRSGSKRRSKAAAAAPSGVEAYRGSKTKAKGTHQERAEESQGAIPDITISGIAWQEERNLRRAVLNGTLVGEGAEVSGARVVEIKENRVRLSRNGHPFDVVFSSGLSSR